MALFFRSLFVSDRRWCRVDRASTQDGRPRAINALRVDYEDVCKIEGYGERECKEVSKRERTCSKAVVPVRRGPEKRPALLMDFRSKI